MKDKIDNLTINYIKFPTNNTITHQHIKMTHGNTVAEPVVFTIKIPAGTFFRCHHNIQYASERNLCFKMTNNFVIKIGNNEDGIRERNIVVAVDGSRTKPTFETVSTIESVSVYNLLSEEPKKLEKVLIQNGISYTALTAQTCIADLVIPICGNTFLFDTECKIKPVFWEIKDTGLELVDIDDTQSFAIIPPTRKMFGINTGVEFVLHLEEELRLNNLSFNPVKPIRFRLMCNYLYSDHRGNYAFIQTRENPIDKVYDVNPLWDAVFYDKEIELQSCDKIRIIVSIEEFKIRCTYFRPTPTEPCLLWYLNTDQIYDTVPGNTFSNGPLKTIVSLDNISKNCDQKEWPKPRCKNSKKRWLLLRKSW